MIKKAMEWMRRYENLINYLIFGVLTTLVNYLIYLPCYNYLNFSAGISNAIAWAGSVLFAYLTNKPFVFKSHDWSWKTVWPELGRFVGCRFGSGFLETVLILVLVDFLNLNGNLVKIGTSVLVVILNYIASKLLVFRKRA